jgi:hypothetical protein
MSRVPHLFLSSTFYDLQQVRSTLREFVEQDLGYRLLASEHRSFPVDPSLDTIENCRRKVHDDADALILIIGARYGTVVPSSQKSITNLEYSTARAREIPIFAFVHRDVLALLPLVERNPTADYTAVVDSPKLFDFVREVRSQDRVWTFPFEVARDIIDALRLQLAYEMSRGMQLSLRGRLLASPLSDLRGPAFQIAAEQPEAWEAQLFAQVLCDNVDAYAEQRRAHRLGLVEGRGEIVTEDAARSYISAAMTDGQRIAAGMHEVVGYVVNEGFVKGDVSAVVHGARDMARIYKNVLDWAARLRNANVPAEFRRLALLASKLLDDFLREAEEFGPRAASAVEQVVQAGALGAQPLKLTFNYDVSPSKELESEVEHLRKLRQ